MSDTYAKLFRSIAASTIVSEPLATRWLWVTMLSQADRAGKVYGSVPGLARMANITLAECEAGLQCFQSPDPYSRTTEHEGRRIEAIDGGWRLLNFAKYDAMRNEAERREKKREWDRTHRPSGQARAKKSEPDTSGQSDASPSQSDETRQSGPMSHVSCPISQSEKPKQEHVQPTAARFPDFWLAYPNKKGKADALRAWKRKHLDDRADELIAHVAHMAANDDGWRRGFIPMGSTYLNGERWDDQAQSMPTARAGPAPLSATATAILNLQRGKNGRVAGQRDSGWADQAALPAPTGDATR